ncbi:hypothetical protein G3I15_04925, partial [Streptomyces sp. SID10244]|nr:hypothetical protein [Streptomyces sp. SID10244]
MSDDPAVPERSSAPAPSSGYELARQALEEARAAARAAGKSVGQGRSSPITGARRNVGRRRRWSGSGPDG